jgi:Spy/CpxP family protein refolding chaperone
MIGRIYLTFTTFALILTFSAFGFGQDGASDPAPAMQNDRMRPNLLRELGLSREQMAEVMRYNSENRPAMRDAQIRMREANRALDQAIYSEKVEDAVVEQRLKEFQEAQAEVARLRFGSELALRKLLTPEQLVKFRELRRRFAETRERLQQNRRQGPGRDRDMRRQGRPGQEIPPGI